MGIKQLQQKICNKEGFPDLDSYFAACKSFLEFLARVHPTRIVSPTSPNYIFFQYDKAHGHRITRPLNADLFIEDAQTFERDLQHFRNILEVISTSRSDREEAIRKRKLEPSSIDKVVYTIQQSLGSVGDSLQNANQSRKRIGQLFEGLIRVIINAVGVACEPRTIKIPLPGHPGRQMSYELDLVFSRGKAIVASETNVLSAEEIVGSVKTTSKDRIDKVFLDKFLLTRLLGRDVRVIAIFLHDVQRAKKKGNIFGVNSTFKSN
ncbi:MAG: hypothetical protein AAB197_00105, partial [Deltaproteobacteria bacterium]